MRSDTMRASSPILTTAAVSVAVLIAAIGLHIGTGSGKHMAIIDPASLQPSTLPAYIAVDDADGNGTPDWQDELVRGGTVASSSVTMVSTTTDPLSSIVADVTQSLYGGYLSLKQYDAYTPERVEELGRNVAATIRAPQTFTPHTVEELTLDDDVSENRILAYRSDLRAALSPLITDDAPEFELFARYIESKDSGWLEKLHDASGRYSAAEKNVLALKVPKTAAPEHLRIVNALGSYASTVDAASRAGSDAFADVALLQNLNASEEEMYMSFDALAKYYVRTVATQ